VVDEVEVLVEQGATVQGAPLAPPAVEHWQAGKHDHGAVFFVPLGGDGVACGHQRDVQPARQVRGQFVHHAGGQQHQPCGVRLPGGLLRWL